MENQKQARAAVLTRHTRRLETRQQSLAALDRRFILARLISFLAGSIVTFIALFFGSALTGFMCLTLSIIAFSAVVYLHRKVEYSRMRFRLALQLTASQLARMSLDWGSIPAPLPLVFDRHHPFASDLDLSGERSLHSLVDTATSKGGSQRLGTWLLNPVPEAEQIQCRQAILGEMLPLTGFRHNLLLRGMLVKEAIRGHWQGDSLLHWLNESAHPRSFQPALIILLLLSAANITLFLLTVQAVIPPYWTITFFVYISIYFYKYPSYKSLFQDVFTLGEPLQQFRMVLDHLEKYPYPTSGQLAKLCQPFTLTENRPSEYLRKLARLTSAASLGNHQVLSLLLNAVVPWNLCFAFILEKQKTSLRQLLPGWLNTWYELEALSSLANFAYLNPAYQFPVITVATSGEDHSVFEAHDMGHPLIPDEVKACNDFSLRKLGEVVIITGSNMSGKSTFLRTLGINLCLGFAGGPVNAASLTTIPWRLYTCIHVSDSLNDGISYFYAEVRRLKALLDQLEAEHPYPLFFLIDEIFRGTNNRERRIGSQAYLRALAMGHGAGVISTHDLELVRLADERLDILNYHFREDVSQGKMVFDYRLRKGPCPTTNALKIMEMEGLPVSLPAEAVNGQASVS